MGAIIKPTILLVATSILLFVSTPTDGQCSSSILQATENAQVLTSPNYPNNSLGNLNCQFTINGSNSSLIALNISSFYWQNDTPQCSADYVAIYDGNSPNSPNISLLCGMSSIVNGDFKSTGPYLTVAYRFTSPGRFRIEYRALEMSVICPHATVSAKKDVQYITSPDYPNIYPSKMNCQWIIEADNDTNVVALKVLDLELFEGTSTHCNRDYAVIYDGPGDVFQKIQLLCGYISNALYVSSGSSMTVAFHSEALFNQRRGFKFQYSSIEKSDQCPGVTLQATEIAQNITSPNYPGIYPANSKCQWIIAASSSSVIDLNFLSYDLDGREQICILDSVTLYDGNSISSPQIKQLCGDLSTDHYKSSGSYLTIVFQSGPHGSSDHTGFKFEYKSLNKSVICPHTTLLANTTVQLISSPDYPNNYPNNMDCQWTITSSDASKVVALSLMYLDLSGRGYPEPCTADYVAIYDGNSQSSKRTQLLCGYVPPGLYTSSGPSMTVAFHSDADFDRGGFRFRYTSVDKSGSPTGVTTRFQSTSQKSVPDSCSNQDLVATPTAAVINSPSSYPSLHPSIMDCEWHISSSTTTSDSGYKVVLKVDKFSLAGDSPTCPSDYVKIFDGPNATSPVITTLCGQHSDGTFTSTKSHMTIVFHSGGGNNNTKGFHFTYYSKNSAGLLTLTQITFLPIIILLFQLIH